MEKQYVNNGRDNKRLLAVILVIFLVLPIWKILVLNRFAPRIDFLDRFWWHNAVLVVLELVAPLVGAYFLIYKLLTLANWRAVGWRCRLIVLFILVLFFLGFVLLLMMSSPMM
jgi:hypothetical protein